MRAAALLAAVLPLAAGPAFAAPRAFSPSLTRPSSPVMPAVPALPSSAVPDAPAPAIVAAVPSDAAWLSRVLETAQTSRTARAVLRDVAELTARRGRPVAVTFSRESKGAAFDYDTDLVFIGTGVRKKPLTTGATALMHELRHVLQKEWGLPTDAIELELDAYMTDFAVGTELNDPIVPGSYDARAAKAFKRGVEPFLRFVQREYPDNIRVTGRGRGTVEAYVEELSRLRALEAKDAHRLTGAIAKLARVEEGMRRERYPESKIAAFHANEVAPLEKRLADLTSVLSWRDRDLALLATPEGRERFKAFARYARRRARAVHKRLHP